MTTLSDEELLEMYRRMSRIRQFEDTTKGLLIEGRTLRLVPHVDGTGGVDRWIVHAIAR